MATFTQAKVLRQTTTSDNIFHVIFFWKKNLAGCSISPKYISLTQGPRIYFSSFFDCVCQIFFLLLGEESGEKASLMEGSTEEVVFVLGLKE